MRLLMIPTTYLLLTVFKILEFDYGDAKVAGEFFALLKNDKELRATEVRNVIINDIKLFAQIKNREIGAYITKDRRSLPKFIEPLKQNKGLNFEFLDLSIPLKDWLGTLF